MRVEYSRRAIADLRKAAADIGEVVVAALEPRIREIIAHIATHPEGAQRVAGRPGIRVVPLVRYPYRIFYRVLPNCVRILHIRHTSRRPWF